MPAFSRISPCLWFDHEAEEAAQLYTSLFPNSRITSVARYPAEAAAMGGREPGSVMTVAFDLDGLPFTGLNGGPAFKFTEAISFQVFCETQDEIDTYWNALSEGGEIQQCGWLKDRFGVSWQIVPKSLSSMFTGDPEKAARVTRAMLPMKKLIISELEAAAR